MHTIVDIVSKAGIAGLMITMTFEGLSILFPGIFIILTISYFLNLNSMEMFLTAAGMSLTYCIASLIPYKAGFILEGIVKKKYQSKMHIVQHYFNRYGEYSIALLRPFAVGNYISCIAGMINIKLWKYMMLTFLGIFPWSLATLFLGQISKGNIEIGIKLMQKYAGYCYYGIALVSLSYLCFIIFKRYVVIIKNCFNSMK